MPVKLVTLKECAELLLMELIQRRWSTRGSSFQKHLCTQLAGEQLQVITCILAASIYRH